MKRAIMPRKPRDPRLPIWPTLVALAILCVLVIYPITLLLLQSIWPDILDGSLRGPFSAYARMFEVEGVGAMLYHSVRWAGATTLFAWAIGIPGGWLLARTDLKGKRFARMLFLIPIMTPPYVFALSYTLIMLPGGFGDGLTGGLPESLRSTFFSFSGVTFVMGISSMGYVALAIEAHLRGVSTRLEDAAAMLGAPFRVRAVRVLLPALRPAILNSGLLVFLDAISNFGVPAILGPRANLPLLPAEIHALVTSWPVDFPLAIALSTLLVIAALLALRVNAHLLRHAREGSGRTTSLRETTLGPRGQIIAWSALLLVAFAAVVLPYSAMVMGSLVERWNDGSPVLSVEQYRLLLTPGSRGFGAILTSFGLGAAAATICAVLGGFTAYLVARGGGRIARMLDAAALLPRVVPKIVVAVALIMAWNAPWMAVPVYGTIWMLLIAYVALYLSDALRFADSGMRQIGPRLEHAAASLGAGTGRTLRSITLPLLRPALIAGWFTTFISCVRDLVASVMLLPPGIDTVGSFMFSQFEQGDIAAAMAMATIVMVLTTGALMALRGR